MDSRELREVIVGSQMSSPARKRIFFRSCSLESLRRVPKT